MRSLSGPVDFSAYAAPPTAPPTVVGADAAPNASKEVSTFDVTPDRPKEEAPKVKKGRNCWGFGHVVPDKSGPKKDVEKGAASNARPTRLLAPFYGGLGCALSVCKWFLFYFIFRQFTTRV